MNVLFFIGNGLDISLGMKTDYQDFYDYYQKLETEDDDLKQLKKSVEEGRYHTWADLEAGLGEYSGRVESEEVFLKCLEDIKHALEDFLTEQYDKISLVGKTQFWEDFFSPAQHLDDLVQDRFSTFVASFPAANIVVRPRIITLNYTQTLEYIFSLIRKNAPDLLHLHGMIKNGMVLGVNDVNQIANISFRMNRNVIEDFVKPSFNDSCLNRNNKTCAQWIREANVFVLFGTSVGITDRKWWNLIGKRLISDKEVLVIYYPYDKKKDVIRHPNYKLRWQEEYQKELAVKLGVPEDKLELAYSRICVGVNKPIFHLEKK